MSANPQTLTWYPVAELPTLNERCVIHCIRQYFTFGVWDSETQSFWDKDGQPVVGGIEWCYFPDRDE